MGEELMQDAADISWSGGSATWNALIQVVQLLLTKTPEESFPTAWQVATETLLPWFIGAGAALVNLIFFIGFIRQNINLRENVTIEVWIECIIRVIIANTFIKNGLIIISDFLRLSVTATKFVAGNDILQITNPELDAGTILFYLFVGIIYFIVSVVCSVMIMLTILQRYLYINFCVVAMPIGIASLAGGRGIENSGYAWVKTFLTYCFQIVVIAIILRIGSLMASEVPGLILSMADDGSVFKGFFGGLNNLIVMVFMTATIKNSDDLIKRSFDLR